MIYGSELETIIQKADIYSYESLYILKINKARTYAVRNAYLIDKFRYLFQRDNCFVNNGQNPRLTQGRHRRFDQLLEGLPDFGWYSRKGWCGDGQPRSKHFLGFFQQFVRWQIAQRGHLG